MTHRLTFRAALAGAVMAACLLTPALASAQVPSAYGIPSSFKVIVKNCQVSADGGATWTTLWTTGIEMNVAAVAKGQEALKFIENLQLANGTYTRMRYTVDPTIKITGSVAFSGNTYYTSAGATDGTTGPAVEYTYVHPSGDQVFTETVNFTVVNGGSTYVRINFNIDQGLALYAVGVGIYKIYPNTISTTIAVGSRNGK